MNRNKQAVQLFLDDFFRWVYTDRNRDVLGKSQLDYLRRKEENIRKRLNQKFTIMVMGDFKRGKSTLINALLGRPLVTMNVTPETITINEITYGEELTIEALMTDGARIALDLEDIAFENLEGLIDTWIREESLDLTPPSSLTAQRLIEFKEALLKSFKVEELEQVVFSTNREIERITTAGNKETLVFELVTDAHRRGWLTELVDASYQENPGNPFLKKFFNWYDTTIKPQENDVIDGIPAELYEQVRDRLEEVDLFVSNDRLRKFFDKPKLKRWQKKLPAGESPRQRAQHAIHLLHNQFTKNHENGLVILMQEIGKHDPDRKPHLMKLATELADAERYIRMVHRHKRPQSNGYLQSESKQQATHQLPENLENVDSLHIKAPISWLKGIKLVDTPGMSDLSSRFEDMVKNYIPRADAIIYVTMAQMPLSETERAFLKMSVAPRQISKIFFVLNRMDFPRSVEDAERVVKHVKSQLETIFNQINLFPVSAEDELMRLTDGPRPNLKMAPHLESDFKTLRHAINKQLLVNREIVQHERILDEIGELINEIDNQTLNTLGALSVDQTHLNELVSLCNNQDSELFKRVDDLCIEIQEQIDDLRDQCLSWLDDLLIRFENDTLSSLEYIPYKEIQRHFLFFVIDMLTEALQACFDIQQPEIVELTQTIEKKVENELSELNKMVHSNGSEPEKQDRSWPNMDIYSTITDRGVATVYSLVDKFLLVVKDRMSGAPSLSDSQKRRRFKNSLADSLPELRRALNQEIEGLFQQLSKEIINHTHEFAYAVFTEFGTAVKKAAILQGKDSEEISEQRNVLEQLHQHIVDSREKLEDFHKNHLLDSIKVLEQI